MHLHIPWPPDRIQQLQIDCSTVDIDKKLSLYEQGKKKSFSIIQKISMLSFSNKIAMHLSIPLRNKCHI